MVYQIANSYYLMKELGYYYDGNKIKSPYVNDNNKCKTKDNIIKGMDIVKFLSFLIEKTRNNKIERQMIYQEIISINYYTNLYKYIISSIIKIFNHHYEMIYYSNFQQNKILNKP